LAEDADVLNQLRPGAGLLFVLRLAVVTGLLVPSAAAQTTVTLSPSADNTIFSDNNNNSDGAGDSMFAGRTNNGALRRCLVRFDVSSIPSGSTITAVSLRLTMTRTQTGAQNVTATRVLASWGEGTSNAGGQEGGGALATTNDATWQYRFFNTQTWTTLGGQFNGTVSATTSVNGNGNYTWTGATMVSDVQGWVNNSATNFGWIMRGNEGANQTAKRFSTKENTTVANRPQLSVTYTPPVTSGACCTPNGNCTVTDATGCATLGGTYSGIGTSCTPNPCPQPAGACCLANGTCTSVTSAACTTAGGTWQGALTLCASVYCSPQLTPFVDALPIPSVAVPTSGVAGGSAHYDISMVEVPQQLHRDLPATRVWAYNGTYPGPTIEAKRGFPVSVTWTNDLRGANGQLRTTHMLPVDTCLHGPNITGQSPNTVVHLHGLKVAPASDGDPDANFPPGASSPQYDYPNDQPATTLWYHDHCLGLTRLNVYMGLAGFYLIRDDAENALNIPRGVNEIPLVIQDRSFNADGSLRYIPQASDTFFGDKILVNGKVWPFLNVNRGKYRFRIVNGSNNRTLTLALSNGNSFQQIGSDGGLLPAPVTLASVTLQPAERADIVVNFANLAAGSTVDLVNSAPAPFPGDPGVGVVANVMRFNVQAATGFTAALPVTLVGVPRIPESQSIGSRTFTLRTAANQICGHDTWLINDLMWDDITDTPRIGTTEVWTFSNLSTITHPLHVHLVQFQVLDRRSFTLVNNVPTPTGPRVAPPTNELGWKDTVQCPPLTFTRIIARFDGFSGLFPMHCHILEHEDHEMMRQFRVLCDSPVVLSNPSAQTINENDSVTFDVAATGDVLAYRWRRGGVPIFDGPLPGGATATGADTPELVIDNADPRDDNAYDCLITNPCGGATSSAVNLLVRPACPGDINLDGVVNTADLTILLNNFGAALQPGTGGDIDGSGMPTTNDLITLLGHFGQPC